ncbi:MAG TPA: protein-glutamate O-methyltransferase CheR [Aliiroseovarius sp.]|nr:protein-glutamate O-methyltransferase CheR [Aliiroseovarius sp.]
MHAPGLSGPQMDDTAFQCITNLAYREAGLYIPVGKAAMVRTRLARRLRSLNLPDFQAYCELVQGPDGSEELGAMISALTTNVSHFFRESHHFDIMREQVIPGLIAKARSKKRVRIWSAGCSNGQEPYSIAMTLREAGLSMSDDLRILATDIDPQVIAHARAGTYPASMVSGLERPMRERYFDETTLHGDTAWKAKPDIAGMIAFRQLNLLRDWPMRGRFDAIFCRNVVIYFDAETQSRLWQRFAQALEPGGWMFLGHSERISPDGLPLFESRGMTSYTRKAQEPPLRSATPLPQ